MADEQLKQDIANYVDEVWEDVVTDIDRLVRIESVEDLEHAEPGSPWGPGPHKALREACDIAAELGLEATDCDGYIGYADLPGTSDRQLAMIAHSDIVPLGTGWTVDPLKVTRSAVSNAASIARMVLTTESSVVDKPEEEQDDESGHGHGH